MFPHLCWLCGSCPCTDVYTPSRLPSRPPARPPARPQASVVSVEPGIQLSDPDAAPLDVLSSIFNSFGGQLFDTLRSREGLAYSVSGGWDSPLDHTGVFVAGACARASPCGVGAACGAGGGAVCGCGWRAVCGLWDVVACGSLRVQSRGGGARAEGPKLPRLGIRSC